MSRPIAVTVFMWLPPNRGHPIGGHFLGASAPVEEPFHSIKCGCQRLGPRAAFSKRLKRLYVNRFTTTKSSPVERISEVLPLRVWVTLNVSLKRHKVRSTTQSAGLDTGQSAPKPNDTALARKRWNVRWARSR